jgi:Asp-tRNA(Asn)/Glu-tRNA(Gln) amidotransferase A subunit family amidase
MARCVEDLACLFQVIAGPFAGDGLSQVRNESVRVAWYGDNHVAPVAEECLEAVKRAAHFLQDAGYDVREEIPPGFAEGHRLWIELFSQSAHAEIREVYRGRESEAGPLVARFLQADQPDTLAQKVKSAEAVAKAVVERERLREDLLRWLKLTPLILSPVSATPAFEHGAARVEVHGQSLSVFRSCSFAQAVNVFGLPAAVVPVGRTTEGLPFGVQIIGGPFEEARVLNAAAKIEQAARYE